MAEKLFNENEIERVEIPSFLSNTSYVAIANNYHIVASGYTPGQAYNRAITKGYTETWIVQSKYLNDVVQKP